MMMRLAFALGLCAGSEARAAGGHFDVDDAAVLDPGHCQYETWLVRTPAEAGTAFHLGPACRVGPVEIGLNLDRVATAETYSGYLGPQLKWVVDPLIDKLSAGLAWSAAYDLRHGGRPAHTLYAPLTWWAAEKLWIHANVGADWGPAGVRTRRVGASGEWVSSDLLTLIAERVKFRGDWTSRLGARFNLSESVNIDLSAARVGAAASHTYAIGLNHDFAR